MTLPPHLRLRHALTPPDLDAVIRLHVEVYCHGLGFDGSFAAHVEAPLRAWAAARTARDRVWLVDRAGELIGCVAVVTAAAATAQLRWYVVHPSERGRGVGRWLLAEAVAFARQAGFAAMFLWTVNTLTTAAGLYRAAGFRLTDEVPGGWADGMREQRYELDFAAGGLTSSPACSRTGTG